MDPILKQRLVGAAVLSALAVILVPMIFDDTGRVMDRREFEIPEIPVQFEEGRQESVETPKNVESMVSDLNSSSVQTRSPQEKGSTGEKKALTAWVVQVGSFSKNRNANLLRDQLRKVGFPAYVETGKKNGGVLFRVRVGPELDLERARRNRDKIAEKFNAKAIVVSHP